jgi:Outer membrane protein beta-barrel domain
MEAKNINACSSIDPVLVKWLHTHCFRLGLTVLFLCLLLPGDLLAQRRKKPTSIFKAGVIVGVNRSQIDGDFQVGYDHPGLIVGARGGVILHKNFEIATELLYTQRGAKPKSTFTGSQKRIFIDVDYAEVPIVARIMLPPTETRVLGADLYAGVSFGRLLRSDVRPLATASQVDTAKLNYINRTGLQSKDWSFVAGGSFYFSRRAGVTLRHTASLGMFYDNPLPALSTVKQRENYTFFRSYYWTFGLFYDLVSPKPVKKKSTARAKPQPK